MTIAGPTGVALNESELDGTPTGPPYTVEVRILPPSMSLVQTMEVVHLNDWGMELVVDQMPGDQVVAYDPQDAVWWFESEERCIEARGAGEIRYIYPGP